MSLLSEVIERFKIAFAAELVVAVTSGVLVLLLARLLEPSSYGLLFLAISILGTMKFLSQLGIPKSTGRYISQYKEESETQIKNILVFGFALNIIIVIIVSVLLFASNEYITYLFDEPQLAPFLLYGIGFICFGALTRFVRKVLQGFERIKVSSIILAIESSSRLFFAVGLVTLGYGALGALIGYIFGFILSTVIGLSYVFLVLIPEFNKKPVEEGLYRRIVEYAIPLTATNSADILDKKVDTLLIGFFVGPVAVAYYTVSKQIVDLIETPLKSLGFTVAPSFGSQKAKNDIAPAIRLYESALFHSLLLYIPAAAGIMILADPIIQLVFGSEYVGAVQVIQILSLYIVLESVTRVTSSGLDYLGRAKSRAFVKTITSIANFGLNVILIPMFGVIGAAVATVTTYSMYTIANVYIMHLEMPFRIVYLLKKLWITVGITVIMSIPVYLMSFYINGVVMLFLTILLGIIIWAITSMLTGIIDTKALSS